MTDNLKGTDYVNFQQSDNKCLTAASFFEAVTNNGVGRRFKLINIETERRLVEQGGAKRNGFYVFLHVVALVVLNVFALIALAVREVNRAKLLQDVSVIASPETRPQLQDSTDARTQQRPPLPKRDSTEITEGDSRPVSGAFVPLTVREDAAGTKGQAPLPPGISEGKEEVESKETVVDDGSPASPVGRPHEGGGVAAVSHGIRKSPQVESFFRGRLTAAAAVPHSDDPSKIATNPAALANSFRFAMENQDWMGTEIIPGLFLGKAPRENLTAYIPAYLDLAAVFAEPQNFRQAQRAFLDGGANGFEGGSFSEAQVVSLIEKFGLKETLHMGEELKFDGVVNVFGRRPRLKNPSVHFLKEGGDVFDFADYGTREEVEVPASAFGGSCSASQAEISTGVDRFKEAMAYIDSKQQQGLTTYVHCRQGRDRSAAVVYSYVRAKTSLTEREALDAIKLQRANVNDFSRDSTDDHDKYTRWYINPANQAVAELVDEDSTSRDSYVHETLVAGLAEANGEVTRLQAKIEEDKANLQKYDGDAKRVDMYTRGIAGKLAAIEPAKARVKAIEDELTRFETV